MDYLRVKLCDQEGYIPHRIMATNKLTFLYLSEPDVLKVGLTLSEAVELCTKSFNEHGLKAVDNPSKLALHPKPDAFLHAMPGTRR